MRNAIGCALGVMVLTAFVVWDTGDRAVRAVHSAFEPGGWFAR